MNRILVITKCKACPFVQITKIGRFRYDHECSHMDCEPSRKHLGDGHWLDKVGIPDYCPLPLEDLPVERGE